MKRILLLLLLLGNLSLGFSQVDGTIKVSVPDAVGVKRFEDSIKAVKAQIAKIKTGTVVKGDRGDTGPMGPQGPQGLPGRDGVSTGGGGGTGSLFSIKSIKDYGAVENASFIDNTKAIQNAIEDCVAKNIRTLYVPLGRFYCKGSLLVMKPNGFVTLNIVGESSFWDSNLGSEIVYTGSNGFALGIQNGKGCKVIGIRFTGTFNPPFQNDPTKFFSCKYEDYKDGVTRDSQFSPQACVVIDPFTNLPGQMPADGGYPELKDKYGLYPGFSTQTGSTGIELLELTINNFVAGIISSPNGFTRNAEITIIKKIQFNNNKTCIVSCQDQEKGNVVDGIYCWGGHTIFTSGLYGSGRMAGNWYITNANLAGRVNRFIYNDQHGYFPTYISNIFAESLGEWGTINSELACEIKNCHIDFAAPWEGNDINRVFITSWGSMIKYSNCNFRIYDGDNTHKFKVEGNPIWDNTYFNGTIAKTNTLNKPKAVKTVPNRTIPKKSLL